MWKRILTITAQWGFTRNEAGVMFFLAGALLLGSAVRALRGGAERGAVDFEEMYRRYDSAFAARSMAVAETGDAAQTGDAADSANETNARAKNASAKAAAGNRLLDINRASEQRLQSLPGVGPATARAIAAYRREHGRFRNAEELLQVPGIGPKKLARLRPFVTAGGE